MSINQNMYEQGWDAYEIGLDWDDCPYSGGAADLWKMGWTDAKENV